MTDTPTGVVPTRVRFGVLYFGIALAVIQYIDRVCISWAMPDIRGAFGLVGAEHDDAVGWIFSAFTIAYALFEMPTGWLGDRYGPRRTLVRVAGPIVVGYLRKPPVRTGRSSTIFQSQRFSSGPSAGW